MIETEKIYNLVSNYKPPYVYNSREFIPNKTPVYYSGPYWDEKEIQAGMEAFLNGKWVTSGENVYKFEKKFSKHFNTKFSLMVNSGSSANLVLVAGLKKRFNWQDEDEIIVSPVGFPTTISVIYQNRLKPVFVDIEWDTLNFDVNRIEEKINSKTKGIFVSPVLGNPPDFDKLIELCEKYDLKLIGDNCDSLGSKWNGKYLNEYYVGFSNSFYPSHHISTGEGGMVCTDDEELMRTMTSIAWWGRDCYCIGSANLLSCGSCGNRFDNWLENYNGVVDHKYVFTNIGYNVKPLDLQGAIGIIQLGKFGEIESKRVYAKQRIEKIFTENIPNLRSPIVLDKAETCRCVTPFIFSEPELKRKLVKHLEDNKVQTRNYFAGNILLHEGYKFLGNYEEYVEANKVLDDVFFIGASPHYGEETFEYIEKVVKDFRYE